MIVILAHPVVFGRAVDDGEAELLFGGAEFEHEIEHHFIDFLGAAVGLVDFVDDNDGLETDLEGFLQDKARLGHGAFEASTSSRQPSAMLSTRSTSPPKSE